MRSEERGGGGEGLLSTDVARDDVEHRSDATLNGKGEP